MSSCVLLTLILQRDLVSEAGRQPACARVPLGAGNAEGCLLLQPSQQPDEDHIRQLTDVGFPRAAAIRALSRTDKHVNLATEYL